TAGATPLIVMPPSPCAGSTQQRSSTKSSIRRNLNCPQATLRACGLLAISKAPMPTPSSASLVKLPPGLWTATATPALPRPPLEGEQRADVCVIGGGFTGLSAALHLAESGASVVVLEAGEVGAGASGRNGGQVIPGLKLDPSELETMLGPERGARLA